MNYFGLNRIWVTELSTIGVVSSKCCCFKKAPNKKKFETVVVPWIPYLSSDRLDSVHSKFSLWSPPSHPFHLDQHTFKSHRSAIWNSPDHFFFPLLGLASRAGSICSGFSPLVEKRRAARSARVPPHFSPCLISSAFSFSKPSASSAFTEPTASRSTGCCSCYRQGEKTMFIMLEKSLGWYVTYLAYLNVTCLNLTEFDHFSR